MTLFLNPGVGSVHALFNGWTPMQRTLTSLAKWQEPTGLYCVSPGCESLLCT